MKKQLSFTYKILSGIILLAVYLSTFSDGSTSSAQAQSVKAAALLPAPHQITYFRDNKPAAVSFSFDDGYTTQWENGIPELNQRGIKGTFFLITGNEWISDQEPWATWQTVAAMGHEIGAHTVHHDDGGLTQFPDAYVRSELSTSQSDVNLHIPGQSAISFAYPETVSNPTVEAIAAEYFVAARGGWVDQGGYDNYYDSGTDINGSWDPVNFYATGSFSGDVLGDVDHPLGLADPDFNSRLTFAKTRHGWLSLHFHQINNPAFFGSILDYIQDDPAYWIDTYGNIARYMKERMNSTVVVITDTASEIRLQIDMNDSLETDRYNVPLTMRSKVPASWTQVRVQQGSTIQTLPSVVEGSDRVVYYNALPKGGDIVLNPPNPIPTLVNMSPSSAFAGGPAFTLTVNGTNFVPSSVVRWNNADRATTYVSGTQLTASILASDIASAGTASVKVFNPALGGGISNQLTFTINQLVPPGAFNKTSPADNAVNQSTSPTLSWGTSSGATSYEYCYGTTNPCSNWTNNGTSTSKTLIGLTPGTAYYWHVRANNTDGTTYSNGSSSAFRVFTTVLNPPGAFNKTAPANGATNQSASSTLSWGTSSGATSYEFCFDTTNDNACSNWISNGTSTSTVPGGMTLNTTYYWHVRAVNADGTTYSNGSSITFWSFTTSSLPGSAPLNSPIGNIGTNYSPSFVWNEVSGATYYYLYISGPSGKVLDQWYQASAICSSGTCTVVAPVSLGGGNHTWYVQTYNSAGYGPWSSAMAFNTTIPTPPAAATLTSPTGNISTNYSPNFVWNEVAGSTWYYLWVNGPSGKVFDQWYQASAICNAGTCTVVAPVTLGGGNHTWYVQTYNSAGFGPWSSAMAFNTFVVTPPAAATLTSPTGNIGTNYTPNFVWNEVATSTWYYLYINGPSGKVLDKWYQASAICSSGTCTAVAPVTLGGGNHTWWVQTWNSAGYGPWSSGMAFSTTVPTPPAPTTLVSPTGSGGANPPVYTWNKVSNATWYYVWVDGPSGNVLKQWYQASLVCGASTCSVTQPAALANGSYIWWVQTWNSAGYGLWSTGKNFSLP